MENGTFEASGGLIRSESLGELLTALAKAQAEIKNPPRDRQANIQSRNGSFRAYRYSDLSTVAETIHSAFAKNGLSVTQWIEPGPEGYLRLRSFLGHCSGQYLSSVFERPCEGFDIQQTGSLLTYMRRYSLSALAGIAPEDDDDGQAAAHPAAKRNVNEAQMRAAIANMKSNVGAEAYSATLEKFGITDVAEIKTRELGEKVYADLKLVSQKLQATCEDPPY